MHGPWHGAQTLFGLFSDPSVRPSRWSALSRPETFLSILPVRSNDVFNNELEIVTGQLAGGTTNAASFCGNPPEVGQLKRVKRRVRFGKYFVKTELNRIPVTGMRRSYGDVPGNIINAGPAGNPFIPDIMFNMTDTRSELRTQLYRVGVDLERTMEVVAMRGTAATDNSRTGWFEEFGGLDGLITTGITDVDLAIPAPAADSMVVSFNADVEGTATDGRNLAEVINDTWYALQDNADRVGVQVQYAIVMRKEAFRRVVDTLACTLNIYQCAGTAAAPNNRDASGQQALRIEMQTGRFLWIEGTRVPVVFSEGILHEVLANNTYKPRRIRAAGAAYRDADRALPLDRGNARAGRLLRRHPTRGAGKQHLQVGHVLCTDHGQRHSDHVHGILRHGQSIRDGTDRVHRTPRAGAQQRHVLCDAAG
jgi:hypothetical protein